MKSGEEELNRQGSMARYVQIQGQTPGGVERHTGMLVPVRFVRIISLADSHLGSAMDMDFVKQQGFEALLG
jgi:hypothetical protein